MTDRRLLGVLALAAILVVSGCAAGSSAHTSTASPSQVGTTVRLVRTGGLAGIRDAVVIGAGGAWTATDRAGNQRSGQLTGQQLQTLRQLTTDPRLPAEARRSRGPAHCADVYEYELTVGTTLRISYPDCPTDTDTPQMASKIVALVTRAVWG
jgi:hypothetical protein